MIIATLWFSRRSHDNLVLLRLAVIPISAYLLLTTTVHPWYVTLLLPLLPFMACGSLGPVRGTRFVWAWLYFAWVVSFSYLTYLGPVSLHASPLDLLLEYLPLYGLLIWSVWPSKARAVTSAAKSELPQS